MRALRIFVARAGGKPCNERAASHRIDKVFGSALDGQKIIRVLTNLSTFISIGTPNGGEPKQCGSSLMFRIVRQLE